MQSMGVRVLRLPVTHLIWAVVPMPWVSQATHFLVQNFVEWIFKQPLRNHMRLKGICCVFVAFPRWAIGILWPTRTMMALQFPQVLSTSRSAWWVKRLNTIPVNSTSYIILHHLTTLQERLKNLHRIATPEESFGYGFKMLQVAVSTW